MSNRMRVNVRADSYFIVEGRIACRQCKVSTPVFAFGVPQNHETLRVSDDASKDPSESWDASDRQTLLFYVRSVNVPVATHIRSVTPCFRVESHRETGLTYWTNHCLRCDAAIDEAELRPHLARSFERAVRERQELSRYAVSQRFEAWADGRLPGAAPRQHSEKVPRRRKRRIRFDSESEFGSVIQRPTQRSTG
jgi:hypothetical protein